MSHPSLGWRHQKVRRLSKLIRKGAYRKQEGVFVLEGMKLVQSAIESGARIESVFLAPGALGDPKIKAAVDRTYGTGSSVYSLAEGVLERVSATVTPQPITAVVSIPEVELDTIRDSGSIAVLVDVRDPGNAGTIVRSAAAAGFGSVVFCEGCVDPFNPKTVRATAGTIFNLGIIQAGDTTSVLRRVGELGFLRCAAVAEGGMEYTSAPAADRTAFVLGNEANGLGDELRYEGLVDASVTIPIAPGVESLNVGTAAAILFFEHVRKRGLIGRPETEGDV